MQQQVQQRASRSSRNLFQLQRQLISLHLPFADKLVAVDFGDKLCVLAKAERERSVLQLPSVTSCVLLP